MTGLAPAPEQKVLSTLNGDGTRRWLRPRVSPGRFLRARRVTAYLLIALFTLLPQLRIGGRPAVLFDLARRELTFFGQVFLPTDTALLALLVIGAVVGLFLVTAIFGRVWCGYACPQTVYLEFVFRPLERLFDGAPGFRGAPGRKASGPRSIAKGAAFLVVSMALAHTFLAYFVGVDALRAWVLRSPLEHPSSFLVMAGTTGLMLFNFGYFREQTCIVACPYGRLQSVLLDRDSLIISYDPARGEPRGKLRRDPGAALDGRGDCVDCGLCVDTCPTGIDIREGLKMECVACAQCIDACDAVMKRVGRPAGLIRYGSQAGIAGESTPKLRPRLFVYPLLLAGVAIAFGLLLAGRKDADLSLLRGLGAPFVELAEGQISNPARLKIKNRTRADAAYTVEVASELPAKLLLDENPVSVPAGQAVTKNLLIVVPAKEFARSGVGGKLDVKLRIKNAAGFSGELSYRLMGPSSGGGVGKE